MRVQSIDVILLLLAVLEHRLFLPVLVVFAFDITDVLETCLSPTFRVCTNDSSIPDGTS